MHDAQIAGMARIAAAKGLRRGFHETNHCPRPARRNGRAQGSHAASNHKDIFATASGHDWGKE
jgi:hypothetical protein